MMPVPQPRGPLSAAVLQLLGRPVRRVPLGPTREAVLNVRDEDVLADEDLQLTLTVLYELHYQGIEGADPEWEWSGDLLEVRRVLERRFEAELRRITRPVTGPLLERLGDAPSADDVARELFALVAADDGPQLSAFMDRRATLEQFREFVTHRSVYHLKEADPHTWSIPRLTGRAKAAMVEVQSDEYGNGHPDEIHAELFARAMDAVGLDSTYGAYLDQIPGVTLATVNLMSFFGLHRRLRGAIVGHLALFEMTSSVPNRRYASGLRRLGYGDDACLFFDVHVVADAVHESVASVDLAGGLARQDPKLGADVIWGAKALLAIDGLWAQHMMQAWENEASSLRPELALH
jgi:hypothetical protein